MFSAKGSMRFNTVVFAVLGAAFLVCAALDVVPGGRLVFGILGVTFLGASVLFWKLADVFTGLPKMPGFGESMRSANDTMAQAQLAMANTTKMMEAMAGTSPEGRRLREHGQDGRVAISAVIDTKATLNFDPILELDLLVFVGDRPPHFVHRREVVSRLVAPRLAPGASFAARIDPDDPNVFTPDWSTQIA